MKTKILTAVLALLFSGTMAFAQSKNKLNKKQVFTTKTEAHKDSVYYTCPKHPNVKMDKPGKCPKCGTELERKTIKITESTVVTKTVAKNERKDAVKIYTCTMHPEVKMDKPGKCPKCGMDLVEKK